MDLLNSVVSGAASVLPLPINITAITAALSVIGAEKINLMPEWPKRSTVSDGDQFDVIIVGGGTAGCVLANRLSEYLDWTVLVVEAGGDPSIATVVPGLFLVYPHSPYDWDYYGEDDGYTCRAQKGHRAILTAGKMFGGSSSLNHLVWARAKRRDFDKWDDHLWNWETCLKYFKKSENMIDTQVMNSTYMQTHGKYGPLTLTGHDSRELFKEEKVLLKSFEDIGHKIVEDTNGPDDLGFGQIQFPISAYDGIRTTPAMSYLLQAKGRSNLFFLKDTLVTKILIDSNKTAFGVKVSTKTGHVLNIFANKEVILSAGTYNSPKLLMLSGVGPKEELCKFKINIKANLPVGRNLMDHVFVPLMVTGKKSPLCSLELTLASTQLGTFPLSAVQGYFGIKDKNLAEIQQFVGYFGPASPIMVLFCSLIFHYNMEFCNSMFTQTLNREVTFNLVNLEHPKSTGNVTLRSINPKDPPLINLGYFTVQEDLDIFAEGIKAASKLKESSYFKKARGEVLKLPLPECEDLIFESDEYWKCYARAACTSNFHTVGTCKMGQVVDTRLKVFGINNLRVIDASVMPGQISGETMAATIMIAERGADLIKEDHGIPSIEFE